MFINFLNFVIEISWFVWQIKMSLYNTYVWSSLCGKGTSCTSIISIAILDFFIWQKTPYVWSMTFGNAFGAHLPIVTQINRVLFTWPQWVIISSHISQNWCALSYSNKVLATSSMDAIMNLKVTQRYKT